MCFIESREVVHKMSGDSRTVRVCFDPNQYLLDVEENDGKVSKEFGILSLYGHIW